MNRLPNHESLPLGVQLALEKIEGIEAAISESIDRFAHTIEAGLSGAIEPNPGQSRAANDKSLPYSEKGPVVG